MGSMKPILFRSDLGMHHRNEQAGRLLDGSQVQARSIQISALVDAVTAQGVFAALAYGHKRFPSRSVNLFYVKAPCETWPARNCR
jgi:hypothetical protein